MISAERSSAVKGRNIEKKQEERFPGSLRSASFDTEQVVKMGLAVKCIIIVILPDEVGTRL